MGHILAALMPANRTVVRVCMATGLRVSDVLELRIQWPAALYEEMERNAGRLWVFESRTDPKRHRTRQAVWKDIKRAEGVYKRSKVIDRRQNIGTHTARKIAAVDAYHKGGLPAAQRLLNHSDPLITRLYALADLEVTA